MARDAIDWVMFLATVGAAVIGAVAIVVALIANGRAKAAERRAIERAAAERRRIFDFEILRDLLAVLDDPGPLGGFLQYPENAALQLGARISMLPAEELPHWHDLMADRHTIAEWLRPAIAAKIPEDELKAVMTRYLHDGAYLQPLLVAAREVLLADVRQAIVNRNRADSL